MPRHSQPSPQTHNNCGDERPLELELANSPFRTSSATPVPVDGDFRAPAMRSTGFKTDLIPQPARVPVQIQEGCRLGRNFPQSQGGPRGRFGFAGRGLLWDGETPPTSFSSFLRPDAGRASLLAAGGMSSPRAEPREGLGCSSLRSEGRKNVLGRKRERERKKKEMGREKSG